MIFIIKKLLLILTCLTVLLTSCTNKENEEEKKKILEDLQSDFSSGVHIVYEDFEAYGVLNKENNDYFDVYFTSPESLKDISITIMDEKAEIKYKDFAFTMGNGNVVEKTAVAIAEKVFNSLLEEKGGEINFIENNIVIKGDTGQAQFVVVINLAEGNKMKLEIPEQNFSMEFNNFTIKK